MRVKANRSGEILDRLTRDNRVEVSQLAKALNVSEVTIRKDLDELESKGILVREHGFAVLKNKDNLGTRIAYHYEDKREIARRAAQLVADGETVMIENGSCCALLADALTRSHSNLTIITNSAYIANYIQGKANFQIILLGGIYQPDSQVLVGPMVASAVQDFVVDKFFIGTDGYSPSAGFTNKDQLRAQAVRDMAKQAGKVYVVTESEKFSQTGVVPLRVPVHAVITDNRVSTPIQNSLKAQNIDVIVAR